MKKKTKILLVGAGPMAIEYAKVLNAKNIDFIVVGNTNQGAVEFENSIKKSVITGGLNQWLLNNQKENLGDYKAIVVVPENLLGSITIELLNAGCIDILLEKPGGINFEETKKVSSLASQKNAKVYIGYNRRFFSSTLKVKELIKKDGGLTSFNFEFTEWGHIIKNLSKNKAVLNEWFFQNSSHVIDLAFSVGGFPIEISSFVLGGQSWHPNGTIFSGAGITDKGALFSYNANWDSAGRWWVEFLTKENRYILKPLEQLFVQKRGSIELNEIELEDELDKTFKPGLYKQLEAYLNLPEKLMKINQQVMMLQNYQKILSGINSK